MTAKLQKMDIRLNKHNQLSYELMTNKTSLLLKIIYILTWNQDYDGRTEISDKQFCYYFACYYNEEDGQQALTSSKYFYSCRSLEVSAFYSVLNIWCTVMVSSSEDHYFITIKCTTKRNIYHYIDYWAQLGLNFDFNSGQVSHPNIRT